MSRQLITGESFLHSVRGPGQDWVVHNSASQMGLQMEICSVKGEQIAREQLRRANN